MQQPVAGTGQPVVATGQPVAGTGKPAVGTEDSLWREQRKACGRNRTAFDGNSAENIFVLSDVCVVNGYASCLMVSARLSRSGFLI